MCPEAHLSVPVGREVYQLCRIVDGGTIVEELVGSVLWIVGHFDREGDSSQPVRQCAHAAVKTAVSGNCTAVFVLLALLDENDVTVLKLTPAVAARHSNPPRSTVSLAGC